MTNTSLPAENISKSQIQVASAGSGNQHHRHNSERFITVPPQFLGWCLHAYIITEQKKLGTTSSFPLIWHFSGELVFHMYLFSPFLAFTKTGGPFLYLLQLLLPCRQWGPLAYIYISGLPERKTRGERSRGGGEDTYLGFVMRWSQDASRLLDTGKHSRVLWLVCSSLSWRPCEEKDGGIQLRFLSMGNSMLWWYDSVHVL